MAEDIRGGLPAVLFDSPSPALLAAIAAASKLPHPAAVHMLHDDANLRLLLAVWPLVGVYGQEIDLPEMSGLDLERAGLRELASWIWRRYSVGDDSGLRGAIEALTYRSFPARSMFALARDAALLYPCGIVHPTALNYLACVAVRLTNGKG